MHAGRDDFRALLLPAAIALLITLAYFVLSDNWTNLANPFAGIVAILAGSIGFAIGAGLDLRRRAHK